MIFDHAVKFNGRWYEAGVEVPMETEIPFSDIAEPEVVDVEKSFDDMDISELREYAKIKGVKLPPKVGKSKIIEILTKD